MSRRAQPTKQESSRPRAVQQKPTKSRKPSEIRFYDRGKPYYEFTNFSPHSIRYNGEDYPTSEHLFQSLKFKDPRDADRIRQCKSPRDAFTTAQRMSDRVRKEWHASSYNIIAMRKALLLKFTQHEDLKRMLLDTGDLTLIEDSPIDSFWGVGPDGRGQNQLGIALMRIRTILKRWLIRAPSCSTLLLPINSPIWFFQIKCSNPHEFWNLIKFFVSGEWLTWWSGKELLKIDVI